MSYTPLSPIRYRQVHLDFHTSEHLPGDPNTDAGHIGDHFDPEEWTRLLKLGKVDAINLFAKGHHSWSYYPTKVGRPHPKLKPGLDLLGEQIKACHAADIRCPIYFTVGWSSNDAEDHPEWCVRTKDGKIHTNNPRYDVDETDPEAPFDVFAWKFLCPSGEYRKLMLDQTREILETYEVDGFWYDICNLETCWCDNCRAGMKEKGYDPDVLDDAERYCVEKWDTFLGECRELIASYQPTATVFFNGLLHVVTPQKILDRQTHYELEDLPTTWGGYDKLPPRARYFAGDGNDMIAMSGKFHTAWGEFGGYKHPDSIRYEAATMVAYDCMCNFGDQLPPSGQLDEQTYQNIGHAYDYIAQIEGYQKDATPVTNLGVMFSVEVNNAAVHGTSSSPHDEGLCCMLLENQIDFERVYLDGEHENLNQFDAIILTGKRCLSKDDAAKIQKWVDAGGKLLILGESMLLEDSGELAFDIGGTYEGPADYELDYTVAGDELQGLGELGKGPFLNYEPAPKIVPTDGQVLAHLREPYFNRTYGHFTSHQNTPYKLDHAKHVAALKKGNIVTLPHPMGEIYLENGARQHRELVTASLKLLGFEPIVKVDGLHSSGRMTFYKNGQGNHVMHLTYAVPTPRGRCTVIEDLPTLHDVKVSVKADGLSKATLPLTGQDLNATRDGDRLTFTVPTVQCHEVIELT